MGFSTPQQNSFSPLEKSKFYNIKIKNAHAKWPCYPTVKKEIQILGFLIFLQRWVTYETDTCKAKLTERHSELSKQMNTVWTTFPNNTKNFDTSTNILRLFTGVANYNNFSSILE